MTKATQELAILNAKLPAHLQGAVNASKEFSGGVQSGFPVISYRGRVWRLKEGGEEKVHADEHGDALASIEVVLIRSNERPAKIHYDKKYEEGDEGRPRCWSPDGIKPDAEVEKPIHATCQSCPMNVWGSRITEAGKKTRACADVRRVAVQFAHRVMDEDAAPLLLRIPPASLNPLKDYVTKELDPKGVQAYMLVTKIGFDNDADYPKLTFKPIRFLSEDEYNRVLELRDGEEVQRIVQTSGEFVAEGPTAAGDEPAPARTAGKAEAAAAPSTASNKDKPKAKGKKRDATAAEAEAAAAAAATVVDEKEETVVPLTTTDEDEQEDESEETTDEGGGDDFDAMLKSVLGE